MVKPILSRFFAALVSVSLLFAASPSFAAMDCCDPVNMALQMADMHMADMGHHDGAGQQKNAPCKMPAGTCAAMCVSMASVALAAPQVVTSIAPTAMGERTWSVSSLSGGISSPPALPPPILSA